MSEVNSILQLVIILLINTANAEQCSNGDIRLANSVSFLEGRVEVCQNSTWGTVCDDMFDENDARVACSQLGLGFQDVMSFGNAQYGQGTGPIWLDNLMCTGDEASLFKCLTNNCLHDEDAGVRCSLPAGVILALGGRRLSNNSVVSMDDIGFDEGSVSSSLESNALICVTDHRPCCLDSGDGHWFDPDGNMVSSQDTAPVFVSRDNLGAVKLNYRGSGLDPGVYRCELPGQDNMMQSHYVGIYGPSGGELSLSSLTYNSSTDTLHCTSGGGPVTDLYWLRDGVMVDTSNTDLYTVSRYVQYSPVILRVDRLTFSDKSSSDSGTYECRASNAVSQESLSLPITVCRDGETRWAEIQSVSRLQICSGNEWYTFRPEAQIELSNQPTITLFLQTNSSFVEFSFQSNGELLFDKFEIACSTQGFSISKVVTVDPPMRSVEKQALSSLQPRENYRCCVTLFYVTDLIQDLRHVNRGCVFTATSAGSLTGSCEANTITFWLAILLGVLMIVFLLILLVVSMAFAVYCSRKSKKQSYDISQSEFDGLTDENPAYNALSSTRTSSFSSMSQRRDSLSRPTPAPTPQSSPLHVSRHGSNMSRQNSTMSRQNSRQEPPTHLSRQTSTLSRQDSLHVTAIRQNSHRHDSHSPSHQPVARQDLLQPQSSISRQDSVADNPIYGTSTSEKPPPPSGSFYDSVDEFEQSVDIGVLPAGGVQLRQKKKYLDVPTSTTIKNPVYGGHVRYSQLDFGKFS